MAPHSLREAVVDPFVEFFSRGGIRHGLAILAFMFLYKLGDNMATALAQPFYLDMGYSNTEIGSWPRSRRCGRALPVVFLAGW